VVVAETQTLGRGRRGRVWRDEPGASLLMSIVLRTSLPVERQPLLSLVAGVAVVEALRERASIDARLKWPNDVQVSGRKICGILLERRGDVVVLGMGINVMQRAFPAELAAIATSIALERGNTDREALLSCVRERVAQWRGRLEQEGIAPIRAAWMRYATTPGQRVSIDGVLGVAHGLDDDGALLVGTGTGMTRILAGDLTELGGRDAV
jgi:BirA family transcriptional regulator, biotin operon repressor / biotin---[acetyl-CoA-carboxylase] ligase